MRLEDAWNFRHRPYGTADSPPLADPSAAGTSGSLTPEHPDASHGPRPATLGEPGDPEGPSDIVHDTLKGVDVWFGYQTHELEREARGLAEQHAAVGQPRHDLKRDGPLEMELLLEKRGAGILHQWITRVQRRLQGAIEAETERIGSGIAAARQAIDSAESARDEMVSARAGVPALHLYPPDGARDGDTAQPPPDAAVECERHLGGFGYWALLVLLVLADFLANAPLFTELFPANRAVDEALAGWEEQMLAEGGLLAFGPLHLVVRLSAHMEATLLALSVVVFFVFLGHVLGSKARTLVALRRHRRTSSALADSSRQAWLPVLLCLVGISCTIAVLYVAREHVEPMAGARVEQVEGELTRARSGYERALEDPDNLAGIGRARGEVARLEDELAYRAARHDYARSVHAMNLPILGLNLVLVIAAIVAGYLHKRKRYPFDSRAVDAEAARRRMDELRAAYAARSRAAHEAVREVGRSMVRVAHLLKCDVASDWQAKAGRIQEAASLFRIENARLRNLDVKDVLAFQTPFEMRLPTPQDAGFQLEPPPALRKYAEEHARLQAELNLVEAEPPEPARTQPIHTGKARG